MRTRSQNLFSVFHSSPLLQNEDIIDFAFIHALQNEDIIGYVKGFYLFTRYDELALPFYTSNLGYGIYMLMRCSCRSKLSIKCRNGIFINHVCGFMMQLSSIKHDDKPVKNILKYYQIIVYFGIEI